MGYIIVVLFDDTYPVQYCKTWFYAEKYIRRLTKERPDMEDMYSMKKVAGLRKLFYLWWWNLKLR